MSSLTVVLWPGSGNAFEKELLGRPVWRRTLEAARPLKPSRTLLVWNGSRPFHADGVETVSPAGLGRRLSQLGGKLLFVAAELPCLSSKSLKRVVSACRQSPSRLRPAEANRERSTSVLCCTVVNLRRRRGAIPAGLNSLGRDLRPSSVPAAGLEELLRVRTTADWIRAVRILRRRTCDRLISKGVVMDDPSTVHIDPDVKVSKGTRIHGWVVIEGTSRIGARCDIGSFTHITDSVIGSDTVLLDHCFVRSSRIGRRAQVGPFAHLRPESFLGARTKVGNFVEMKKASLGSGSKAPHLSYLGDTTIGRRVNVGAGTITCNYDGKQKHETIVEDGVFIGSDVQLVAPVRVGRGAYVAAGSCIVEDVPARSLAIARSRQVIKAGYAGRQKRRRRR